MGIDDVDFGGISRAMGGGGISEAQWNEANEIFGIDYANVIGRSEQDDEEEGEDAWSRKK